MASGDIKGSRLHPAVDIAKKRRHYEPPCIVHCEKLESLAAVCDSSRAPGGSCRVSSVPACINLFS